MVVALIIRSSLLQETCTSHNIVEQNKMYVPLLSLLMLLICPLAYASDPDPLQDICVAVNDSQAAVFVNGKICKDPGLVTADDFFSSRLSVPGNISSFLGTKVTTAFVDHLPGANTLGVSMARIDFAPYGDNPPHVHPRASELFYILEGSLYAGFLLSNPGDPNQDHKLYAKILRKGDFFVFPRGLIHFQYNIGETNAVALASFNSQNPGVITIANTLFASEPPVFPDVIANAFQLDEKLVLNLQSLPWEGNN